jgi:hypothetical protein
MKLYQKSMPHDYNLFLFGDDHEGTLLRNDAGWNTLCDMMCSEYDGLPETRNYGIHHGDFMEAISVDDYRFDMLTTKEAFVLRQLEESKKNIWPIKDKLITILDGNHAFKLQKYGEQTRYLCEERLEMPDLYGTWSCHITYLNCNNEIQFKHFATHGGGSINSYAGDVEQQLANLRVILKRRLKNKFGDTLLNSMGHTHKLIICPPLGSTEEKRLPFFKGGKDKIETKQLRVEKVDGYIHPDFRWYVNTGSFLNLYTDKHEVSGYAERANYDPTEQGFAICLIRNSKLKEIRKIAI